MIEKKISPARAAAFAILERVATTQAHSDDLLHGPGMNGLSQADKNLATTLVLGVLRWQIALDARIRPLLKQPELQMASPVATALRMGLFQLLHLDRVPAHAALSESVELVRAAGHGHASGMVNAILRKVTRQDRPKPKLYESTAAFAERLSHPAWLVERWVKNYGRSAAMAVCEYGQSEPAQGGLFAPDETMPPMDDGSRLVAELAAASADAPQRIWDCCAAPGGKTLVIAGRHAAAELLASDANPKRVKSLAERLRGCRERTCGRSRRAEASRGGRRVRPGPVRRSVQRHGDAGPQPGDQAAFAARRPLAAGQAAARDPCGGVGQARAGGRLLYSTCSLEPEENERVLEDVLASLRVDHRIAEETLQPVLERLTARGALAKGTATTALLRSGRLRTLPGAGFQGDGFFAALLVRGNAGTSGLQIG